MTPCTGKPADIYLERYLQGSLPEPEAQEFEEHYFACPVCHGQVQAFAMVAAKLVDQPPVSLPQAEPARRVLSWPVRLVALGAIAAMLVIGVLGFRAYEAGRHPSTSAIATAPPVPQPTQITLAPATPVASTEVASLADLSLPPFKAMRLRGSETASAFADGMAAYTRHDCRGAVKSLSQVPKQDENELAAEFYTGACEMKSGNMSAATAQLQQVVNAGDSPQQEASLYYLAQVSLAGKNTEQARQYLGRAIALHGEFERRSRVELDKLH
jgi:tetratricopeptide (TPR) repeat protein